MDVERGPKEDVHAVFPDLVAHGPADALDEVQVPGGGERGGDGGGGAVVRPPLLSLARGLDAQAGGTVRHHDGGNSQTRYGEGGGGGGGEATRGDGAQRGP